MMRVGRVAGIGLSPSGAHLFLCTVSSPESKYIGLTPSGFHYPEDPRTQIIGSL